jgi:hypothetical protein
MSIALQQICHRRAAMGDRLTDLVAELQTPIWQRMREKAI